MIQQIKKSILGFGMFLLFAIPSYACNYQDSEIYGTASTILKNNIREVPCQGTKVFGTTKVGVTYEVVGQARDYYKVIIDGQKRYIWKEGVHFTEKKVPPSSLSPLEQVYYNYITINIDKFGVSSYNAFEKKLRTLQTVTTQNSQIIPKILQYIQRKKEEVKENFSIYGGSSTLQNTIGEYWLQLYNTERTKLGLEPYIYDTRLQYSAEVWAKISANRGKYSHKRDKGDVYYDFWKIQNWFKKNGVDCKIEGRTAAVENIGYGILYCKEGECIEELKKTVKRTFDGYMREKGKANSAHYDSIVSPYLNYMGFGIYKKPLGNDKYGIYNVTHYCTNFKN